MPPITHVYVTVPEDANNPREISRRVPMLAGGDTARLLEPGKLYAVPFDTYIRKRIAAGDLAYATKDGKAASSAADASAPSTVKLEADGTVATDQRPDDEINAEAEKTAAAKAAADAKLVELERGKHAPAARSFDTSDTKGKA